MTDTPPTLDEMQRILDMMAKHGVTNLKYRGLEIVRVPEGQAPTPQAQREIDRLGAMNGDKLDAVLYQQRYGGR